MTLGILPKNAASYCKYESGRGARGGKAASQYNKLLSETGANGDYLAQIPKLGSLINGTVLVLGAIEGYIGSLAATVDAGDIYPMSLLDLYYA